MTETYVALDLETTGLDADRDAVIEIGAVKFSPDSVGVLDQFVTLVKPYRPIPERVQALTGITPDHVREAPILEVVASDLEAFLGDHPLVGHNAVAFDVPFLDARGIRHSPIIFDTLELASLLLPGIGEYSLGALADHFHIPFPVRHRALPDALAAKEVFLALRRRLAELPPAVLSQVAQWLVGTRWPWRTFFSQTLEEAVAGRPFIIPRRAMAEPLPPPTRRGLSAIDPEQALTVLTAARERREVIPQFEERPEQQAMLRAIVQALNDGQPLIVEAGTGTGKSLAYLIPAALYALANGSRIVISTATINLQEQLSGKDIPALKALLAPSTKELGTAVLKGRRNYLCLRRFAALQGATALTDDEAKLMARILIWLTQTDSGDRGELNLSKGEEALWPRLSAEGIHCQASNCPFVVDGTCFLLRARRRAEAAHIVVVNHALLLSDIAVGGYLLPPYENLIIDEAHHLEEEASRQLGFSAREGDIIDLLEGCTRLAPEVGASARGGVAALSPAAHLTGIAAALAEASARGGRPRLRQLADTARAFLRQHSPETGEYDYRLLINSAMRSQPDWSQVEVAWENLRLSLTTVLDLLDRLAAGLAETADSGLLNYELLANETNTLYQRGKLLLDGIAAAIEENDPQRVVWFEEDRKNGGLTVAWVPLHVADVLRDRLYADKNAVILTGATLAAEGGFDYLRERLGLDAPRQLLLGSSFDYRRAALILVPKDMPEPGSPHYLDRLAQAVSDLARATQGRALVLFTAHSTLRAAYPLVRSALQGEGIDVLGQGIDGPPQHLLQALRANPRTVLLGTASFWEGVDVAGEALSLLVIARLPFSVPSEPIFAARSALYDDPFSQYALPQAVLRFKQGFGRLIRSKSDRGVVVVLDRRIQSKRYGRAFLGSLPPCPVREVMLREMPSLTVRWLNQSYEEA